MYVTDKYPSRVEQPIEVGDLPKIYPPVTDDGEFDRQRVDREGVWCMPQFSELTPDQVGSLAGSLKDPSVREVFYTFTEGDETFLSSLDKVLQAAGRPYEINPHFDSKVSNPDNQPASVIYNHFTLLPNRFSDGSEVDDGSEDIDNFIGVLDEVAKTTLDVIAKRATVLTEEERFQLAQVQQVAFTGFVENHPGNQVESPQEFIDALSKESTVMVCHKGEDGLIDGYMYFSTEVLPWLNVEYYESLPKENRLFFVSIGSMQPDGGLGVASRLMEIYGAAINRGTTKHNLYFQCTNRSNEYVGPIIRHFAERYGASVESKELARVFYRSIEFRD